MTSALVGHSGYVGSTLLRQRAFEHRFRSTDIAGIDGGSFETVVCAGAPAQKWKANADPETDIARVRAALQTALMRERIATRRRSRG